MLMILIAFLLVCTLFSYIEVKLSDFQSSTEQWYLLGGRGEISWSLFTVFPVHTPNRYSPVNLYDIWDTLLQRFQNNHRPNEQRSVNALHCSFCNKPFATPKGVKRHELIIHLKPFPFICSICGKGARTKVCLQGHMSTQHGMAKQYRCDICNVEIAYKNKFKAHMLRHKQFQ